MDFSLPIPRDIHNYLYRCTTCQEKNWFVTQLPDEWPHTLTSTMQRCSGQLEFVEKKSKLTPMDLVAFYEGTECTPEGYYLSDILSWNDEQLEKSHTFIQWLFPNREASQFNEMSPVLNDEVIEIFKSRSDLIDSVRAALIMMVRFYGGTNWLTPVNHNYLRLTRILKCLREFGMTQEATYLFSELSRLYQEHAENISEKTFNIWKEAYAG